MSLVDVYKLCYKKGGERLAYSKLENRNLIYKSAKSNITIQASWSGRNDLDFLTYWDGLQDVQSVGWSNNVGPADYVSGGITYHLEWGGDNTGEGTEVFGVNFVNNKKVQVHMNFYGGESGSPDITAIVEYKGRSISLGGLHASSDRPGKKAESSDPGFYVRFYTATSGANEGKRVCVINDASEELVLSEQLPASD